MLLGLRDYSVDVTLIDLSGTMTFKLFHGQANPLRQLTQGLVICLQNLTVNNAYSMLGSSKMIPHRSMTSGDILVVAGSIPYRSTMPRREIFLSLLDGGSLMPL
jgi:hypothetical protein